MQPIQKREDWEGLAMFKRESAKAHHKPHATANVMKDTKWNQKTVSGGGWAAEEPAHV